MIVRLMHEGGVLRILTDDGPIPRVGELILYPGGNGWNSARVKDVCYRLMNEPMFAKGEHPRTMIASVDIMVVTELEGGEE